MSHFSLPKRNLTHRVQSKDRITFDPKYINFYQFHYRRGLVYRGIYLPSLGGKLQDERLEFAYLRYAHRQRQKTLMLVNLADIYVKILLIIYKYYNNQDGLQEDYKQYLIGI